MEPGPLQVQGARALSSGLSRSSPPQGAKAGWLSAYRTMSRAPVGRGVGMLEAKGLRRKLCLGPCAP